ncbi:MAG TPA: site-2 protease family protein [Acidimicrobiia bacterium]
MPVLRFRLFNMPVTVRGSFIVIAALIGFTGVGDAAQTVAWVGIVFVSILVHELGHAFTARAFGSEVSIELNGLGGLTRWATSQGQLTPGRRALIAAAGSATGLLFGGAVWLVAAQFGPYRSLTAFILQSLVYVNVFWGLLNWLPIRPLDGGHLLESLLEKIAPRRAETIARVIFTATAAAALALAIWQNMIFIAVLAGWLLLSEFSFGRESGVPAVLPTFSYDDEIEADDGDDRPHEPDEVIDPEESGELPR